jgi:hypothetical protein
VDEGGKNVDAERVEELFDTDEVGDVGDGFCDDGVVVDDGGRGDAVDDGVV